MILDRLHSKPLSGAHLDVALIERVTEDARDMFSSRLGRPDSAFRNDRFQNGIEIRSSNIPDGSLADCRNPRAAQSTLGLRPGLDCRLGFVLNVVVNEPLKRPTAGLKSLPRATLRHRISTSRDVSQQGLRLPAELFESLLLLSRNVLASGQVFDASEAHLARGTGS